MGTTNKKTEPNRRGKKKEKERTKKTKPNKI
jgi:hypothetical protein